MSSQLTGVGTEQGAEDFGANEWLVEELYEQYRADRSSVDESWWPILERYGAQLSVQAAPAAEKTATVAAEKTASPPAGERISTSGGGAVTHPVAAPAASRTTSKQPKAQPIPADAPVSKPSTEQAATVEDDQVSPLRGMAKSLATNMDASLSIPTATSVRTIPAKLMIDNRIVINNHLRRTRGGKVSFTHLIGWALIRALHDFPSQNVYYDEVDGKPSVVAPAHVNLGIAIDMPKPDGTRALLVPSIKRADTLSFTAYLAAYEDLVKRARGNKLVAGDFAGTTLSLTNPGGIGTVHSVPRLMKGQGCIIGAGALEYPAEFQGASEKTLVELGIGKTITLTSTYDHRVIQGAGSGEFLKIVHELLLGKRAFYEDIFAALRIPYDPIHWSTDIAVDLAERVSKTARVQELINSFRVRGHLMADVDPLEYVQRSHPDLAIESHGLTFWDLDREFVTDGFGGKRQLKLREILGILRDSYCRTVGVEYMHIQDPEQRAWMQAKLERGYEKPGHDEQLRILGKLNEAEAFETFLQTKYVGQKRFSLEGGESLIALLDAVLQGAADAQLDEVAIGMAHRGRLNVLTNIAGKTYGQIFREFEGTQDPRTVQGSGDVKYHLGTEGTFRGAGGEEIPVYLAANPSHLEAVNGVLEGIVRAKQDRKPIGTFTTLPILVHGDAAMAGQGVVVETLQMSQLRAYRTGGTIHVNINNQVGFTTPPHEARTSIYSTDGAKTIQAPIFHVNGDDPEAVVHVAQLAFEYRQQFHRDVVIDLICYRRRGHNEGDDPSMTQPLMYSLIEAKRSVRKLYTEALVGRGDITEEEYDRAHQDFQERLERAFAETHAAQTGAIPVITADGDSVADLELPDAQRGEDYPGEPEVTGVKREVITRIGDAFTSPPEGFTVHPKLQQLLTKRQEMSRSGSIDWAFGELLALGSLLLEDTPVRLVGQDTRRGTFVQRHAVLHDRENGQEWLPLMNLSEQQARLWIYDSLLSEYAAMAFEYGYSVERPDSLVLWEAQFGDFANGAQIVIDEFISSAEQKWGQRSSLVLLLPHGYEGQGPDHSSARIERYLQLCAERNMTVARPSTPASYFHLLRRQAYSRPRRPLVVFTPKAMLRLRGASSPVEDFTSGRFEPVLDDARIQDASAVKRVLLHAGKVHYDLKAELEKKPDAGIALVRVEQYYPAPVSELRSIADRYPDAEFVWVQDEPENQGAWPFIALEVAPQLGRPVRVVSRRAAASPAAGSAKRHASEQADLLARALTR
ncbi:MULTISPECIES: multifunctional oxoglutarate decarboxylase/oxoglutarate dehydrogenase thiamine pyrophosphate-binding subunit/dihydrolipoyllysine-residue succinyltransferase subunit [unclassified Rathayibacter]|uniref:multifunctional oxoglutarate decarboxylase/oxoglutarate dehydrogenase thiamine pyrophosphate-binding subunit/dihydrolipoyllysine-residue succinyltransferase subunit n=1 Tax=unclassified Rathayibacter TaxID=2609250 RepID=UPI00188AEEDC|nr:MULTISPECIES: multifunctional oxoglutarate decarboxylase/oxoglutarate dehydrogenase thiamine pyrophosphate-binding subunit/dihydrolipoyllysine-residue succinyltransferase subunit [unclassified Rathayibacter]MBF4463389.1 multifunctional oxoglutarate decarboxylase/oxoglutarate dehydrogenase thiamine pyrophosphate-binding subunit/dihydrolipoyllysine-residue succinyltransferase subunit [Rathayibacter sp. VKM Ac-2879]MBF4504888.1 multifunctional oxoglutarate decarboxylase/oxoglutarate dehydrogenase